MLVKDFQQLIYKFIIVQFIKNKISTQYFYCETYNSKFVSFWVWYIYNWTAHIW